MCILYNTCCRKDNLVRRAYHRRRRGGDGSMIRFTAAGLRQLKGKSENNYAKVRLGKKKFNGIYQLGIGAADIR